MVAQFFFGLADACCCKGIYC